MNLASVINHMHFLHGHLVADILVFLSIIAWQGDINKIYFPRSVPLQKLEELDFSHTDGTKAIIQHLDACSLRAEGPMLMSTEGGYR